MILSPTAVNARNLVQYAALAALDPGNDGFVAGVRDQLQGVGILIRLLLDRFSS